MTNTTTRLDTLAAQTTWTDAEITEFMILYERELLLAMQTIVHKGIQKL